ncbi:MAG TPA: serine/threonine-protein kinase [Gemmatimonadales bacterium]|nr:serine/threonine-protein kinase [Gemmatimonadales bacterium]
MTDPVAKTLAIATDDVAERDALLAQLRHELADEYEVERELGRGGMGVVFKAVEIELGRPVALKVLPPGLGQGAAAERFRREARLAAALDHPSIIPIYRVGRVAGTWYFAMKFVEGRALDEIIAAQGALPLQVILAILRSTASALAFAHERQIVHRDIKGANILVDQGGRVMISDFGIARAGQEKTLTAAGAMMGTPYYMSPEQGWGGAVGPQSDQYALGILTFQMITGQVPFDADSLMTILQHHYFTPPPDVRTVRDGLPTGLVQVLERALRKNAADRFASTRDMLAAVEAIPSSDTERAEAHDMLRQLARGGTVAKVRTGSLPPLDTKHFASLAVTADPAGGPAHLAVPPAPPPAPPAGWLKRVPPRRAALGLTAALALVVLWGLGHRRTAPRQSAPVTPPAAVAPSPPAPTTPASHRPAARHAAAARAAAAQIAPSPQPGPAGPAGRLRLQTLPQNATIVVDGETVGTGLLPDFAVAAGRHRIRVSAAGYATLDTTITVTAGRIADVGTISLKRSPR